MFHWKDLPRFSWKLRRDKEGKHDNHLPVRRLMYHWLCSSGYRNTGPRSRCITCIIHCLSFQLVRGIVRELRRIGNSRFNDRETSSNRVKRPAGESKVCIPAAANRRNYSLRNQTCNMSMTTPCSFPPVQCSFRVWNYSGQPFSPCALSPIGIGIQVGKHRSFA